MKKTKTQKGITLMALIITIVVLLILAVVTIRAVQGDGIIGYAKKARDDYQSAQDKEKNMLDKYLYELEGETWSQDKTKVTKGDVTLEVGNIVNYTAGVSGYTDKNGWKVLGVEDGKILLVSARNVTYTALYGVEGYNTGIEHLNGLCEKYKNDTYAVEARSIKVEDINRVTGYNPNKTGTGEIFHKGRTSQYGNEITFKVETDDNGEKIITYESATQSGSFPYVEFTLPDGTKLSDQDNESNKEKTSVKLVSNYYWYYPGRLSNDDDGAIIGLKPGDAAYDLLFANTSDLSAPNTYWLASQYCFVPPAESLNPNWSLFFVREEKVMSSAPQLKLATPADWCPTGTGDVMSGVRAVVKLDQNCLLVPNGVDNSWNIYPGDDEVTKISIDADYTKFYADVDGDVEPDGIIYIDKAKTVSGSWNGYGYTITNVTTGFKEYYISKESHTTTEFGTAPVLSLVPGSTGEERFYVMALRNSTKSNYSTFQWVNAAYGMGELATLMGRGIGAGKTNTSTVLTELNATTPTNGTESDRDMWGLVRDGWYIPSLDEWAAFGSTMEISSSNYLTKGLSTYYWSSSLYSTYGAFSVIFSGDTMGINDPNLELYVRLGTNF